MSGHLNEVSLIGTLGADPDVRTTQDGRQVVNLSIATGESWKDKHTGEKREKTEWHKVVIFSQGVAKVANQYLFKGSKVFIRGSLATRKWQDKDGIDRYTTEIVVNGFGGKLILLGSPQQKQQGFSSGDYAKASRGGQGSYSQAKPQQQQTYDFSNDLDDDVPF